MTARTMDGLEIVNAKEDYIFIVSEKNANDGIPLDIEQCPAAQACVTGMETVLKARFYKSRAYLLRFNREGRKVWYRYLVPKPLMIQEAIIDNGGKFTPGEYRLYAMPPSKTRGGTQGSDTRPEPDPEGTPRRELHKTKMRVNAPTQST